MNTDAEKVAAVDRWLEDVSGASQRWKTATEAQKSSERVVSYLREIMARMSGLSPDLDARMDEAIAKNEANARMLADEAARQAEVESEFYAFLPYVAPAEVAEAWRLRCIGGKTWQQCSMALHYNRQHLERLSKKAKIDVYGRIPEAYR